MIDLETVEYKNETPTEPGWYPIQDSFNLKRKMIADFDGKFLFFNRHTAEPGTYYFGPKIAERIETERDALMHETGLK